MKNFFKFLGIISLALVIGFSMVACGDDEEEGDDNTTTGGGGDYTLPSGCGELTVTGVSEYNGQYATFGTKAGSWDDVRGSAGVNSLGNVSKGVKVENGEVKIPLYTLNDDFDRVGYSGSDTCTGTIRFYSDETTSSVQKATYSGSVTFASGKANVALTAFTKD